MIKIDDNTFIDDTLITCVEYQKFVDELSRNGKYVQPDHWQSPVFSKGESLKPIVGIRLSDAQAFCVWLTNLEQSKWHYRLPTLQESKKYLLAQKLSVPIGYWALSGNAVEFVWILKPPTQWQDVEVLVTKNINSAIARAVEKTPEYEKCLEFAQAKNFNVLNTSIDDVNDILCRAIDFTQAESRINEIIQITTQAFANVCSLARTLAVRNESSLIASLASNTKITDIRRLAVALNSYLKTNQLDDIEFSDPIKTTTVTTEIVPTERPLVIQPKAENKSPIFSFITNRFFALLSLILSRLHLHHLAAEIITILILSLDRESGRNRHVFRDRAKEIMIIRNIDPDLAIAYANAHDAVANIRLQNFYERGSIYQEGLYSKDFLANFGDPVYTVPQEGSVEREVAIGFVQRLVRDFELKSATLFQNDLHVFEQYFAKDFVGLVNREHRSKNKIIDKVEALCNLMLLIQVVYLTLQALSRGKVVTKDQSNSILKDLDKLVDLIRFEQLVLTLLNFRYEGRVNCYESVRIVKERKVFL